MSTGLARSCDLSGSYDLSGSNPSRHNQLGPFTRQALRAMHSSTIEQAAIQNLVAEIIDGVVAVASSSNLQTIYTRERWPCSVCMSSTFRQKLHATLRLKFPDCSVYFTEWSFSQTGPTGPLMSGPSLIIDWSAP